MTTLTSRLERLQAMARRSLIRHVTATDDRMHAEVLASDTRRIARERDILASIPPLPNRR